MFNNIGKILKEANDPFTLDYKLNHLALHKSEKVRAAVAANPGVQHKFLEETLVRDSSVEVRKAAASNPRKLTPKAWDKLREDESPSVVDTLLEAWPERPSVILHGNGMSSPNKRKR